MLLEVHKLKKKKKKIHCIVFKTVLIYVLGIIFDTLHISLISKSEINISSKVSSK